MGLLDSLEKLDGDDFKQVASGTPLQILITDIAEDPDQPRTEFDAEYLTGLSADIGDVGVKSPVSVRSNPTGKTTWMLNYGACRLRASVLAGKDKIPGFVDEQFDDYSQVNENEQRKNLSAMELALFIDKRKKQGDSNADIAKKLRKDRQAVTHHLALIDMPPAIDKAYRESRVTAARVVYDLVKLHGKYGPEVEAWCKGNDNITRTSVVALANRLKPAEKPPESEKQDAPVSNTPIVDKPENTGGTTESEQAKTTAKPDPVEPAKRLATPAVAVKVNRREALIDLELRPTAKGMVFVRYCDDETIEEVQASQCVITEVAEQFELAEQGVTA